MVVAGCVPQGQPKAEYIKVNTEHDHWCCNEYLEIAGVYGDRVAGFESDRSSADRPRRGGCRGDAQGPHGSPVRTEEAKWKENGRSQPEFAENSQESAH